ncbi:increased loss of mitochondrial DNA protein 1 [Apiosordaria backusii]|uniref:Increased loss of mitochondrial DNA protein 1 n=1 Tax=Apiosordaria backusii TaxID=314023 RepID=A0AA40AIV6_9PEZI|nr:increased loss of mitochondrial DNA protein 1 [Apiosordaria backusii]
MALISSKTIITSLSLFHLTLAFLFLTNPSAISDQSIVYLLGESMGLPSSRSFDAQSPALAFLGILLGFLGISDLVTLSYPEEICLITHWGTQAPLRVSISFALAIYSFFFSPSSPLFYHDDNATSRFSHPNLHHALHNNPNYTPSGWGGDALKNRVFFTFMFVETMSWFWIWVTLGEEQRGVLARAQRERTKRRGSQSY